VPPRSTSPGSNPFLVMSRSSTRYANVNFGSLSVILKSYQCATIIPGMHIMRINVLVPRTFKTLIIIYKLLIYKFKLLLRKRLEFEVQPALGFIRNGFTRHAQNRRATTLEPRIIRGAGRSMLRFSLSGHRGLAHGLMSRKKRTITLVWALAISDPRQFGGWGRRFLICWSEGK
jgi:hypothetical protein